jgi:indole-3-acetate monooxygenase
MGEDQANRGRQKLAAAQALLPQIREAADEIERERQLPQSLIDAFVAADLFRLTVPLSLGGVELDPETIVRIIETLATADGSTAWCAGVTLQCATSIPFLSEEVARAMFGTPKDYMAFTIAPSGRAQAVEGGYRLSGRWGFASGCRHATWMGGSTTVYDGETVRLLPDGTPDQRLCFTSPANCHIQDTWHVTGLRGTGSHEFTMHEVFIPEEYAMPLDFSRPLRAERLCVLRLGLVGPIFAATALGLARGALDDLAHLAATKVPRIGGGLLLRDQPVAQHRVSIAEANLRGARALLYETIREAWEEAGRDGPITDDRQTLLFWASTHATAMAAQAVDTAWDLAGGSAVFQGSPFERRFRDMHMVTQQVAVYQARYFEAGKLFLSTPHA